MEIARRHSPRIVHISTAHPWNDTRIFLKEARSLLSAGYHVDVLAQKDTTEIVEGVRCVALPIARNRFERMIIGPWRAFLKSLQYDVCHFHDPELIIVGLLLKLIGKTVIYDVHEDLPRQMADKEWIAAPLRRPIAALAELFETASALAFDRIVAVTPKIASRFRQTRTVLIQNYPLLNELSKREAVPYSKRPHYFSYVGYISKLRGALEMISAMSSLRDPAARLILGGTCSPISLLLDMHAERGWSRVDYRGYVSRIEIAEIFSSTRAGLVLFQPAPNHIASQPNKLFEYMSAGLPVIASNFPAWREIVEGNSAGLLVDPTSSDEIAAAMEWILSNPSEAEAMGRRGRAAVIYRYNWAKEAEKLIAMYASLHRSPTENAVSS